ncbi:hypothetical protein [Aeromonas tecta]|nr:hypothetical protein [Aeromonas tecta]
MSAAQQQGELAALMDELDGVDLTQQNKQVLTERILRMMQV